MDRPAPRAADVVERFRADAREGRIRHDGDRHLAAAMAASRLATGQGHAYLVADARRGVPIAGAIAALLAWEARAMVGPGTMQKQPGRAIFS